MEDNQFLELFTHVRILIAMIISLSVARILSGVAKFLQHPKRTQVSVLHLLWVFSILFELVLFWWWGVRLSRGLDWTFGEFVFQISYAITLYLMAALLFPDDISEYKGYQDFFIQRRYWFFALLSSTWIMDMIKTTIFGGNISQMYLIHAATTIFLCVLGVLFKRPMVQIALVLIFITRQFYSI